MSTLYHREHHMHLVLVRSNPSLANFILAVRIGVAARKCTRSTLRRISSGSASMRLADRRPSSWLDASSAFLHRVKTNSPSQSSLSAMRKPRTRGRPRIRSQRRATRSLLRDRRGCSCNISGMYSFLKRLRLASVELNLPDIAALITSTQPIAIKKCH